MQNITIGYKALCEAAEREIETLPFEQAVKLAEHNNTVLVDIRDIRELQRERLRGPFIVRAACSTLWSRSAKPLPQTGIRAG